VGLAAPVRVAVLASGSGTNLQALLDAAAESDFPAAIAVVLSNRPKAYALERARQAGIPVEVVRVRDFEDRQAYDAEVVRRLQSHGVEWVALAGYMRLVTEVFLDAFPNRVLNIHPSLLPSFTGLHAQEQTLDYGVRVGGCTVHLVDAGTDTGPIIGQAVVPVESGDTPDDLKARILVQEHRLYPLCLRWAVEGRLTVEGRRVHVALNPGERTVLWGC